MRVPGIPYVQGRNGYSDSDGTKTGIAIHNTSNDATAEQEASYATRRTDGISAHFYVDSNSIVQSLDTNARAGHAGSSEGNQNAVAVEITGVNAWTRQQWLDRVAWDKLGAVLAVVCKRYGIQVRRASVSEMKSNPKVKAFYGHNDMRLAWGGTSHTDPGPNFPWDRLFAAVNAALNPTAPEDDMSERAEQQINSVFNGLFYGGTSMGRSVDPDGSGSRTAGNSLVAKLDYVMARIDAQELRVAAVLAAVADRSATTEILARVDQRAAELRADAAQRADAEAARDAELRALVEQAQNGSLDAAEVVRRMGELLAAAPQQS